MSIALQSTTMGTCSLSCMLLCRRDNVCRAMWHRIREGDAASVPGPSCPLYENGPRGEPCWFNLINGQRCW